ncbi:hypothetical protein [Paraburkholderia tuberum]|uniref:Uncharacterized protein n=1 Tax=Paraburkholderia tuberum TaxID=157910 RepID=A0A1H1KM26_9BURK|nr:hypothetical protein [Paraburkholderia tuberum]SDR62815.1 hypothetical protein SAMN05445850_8446 [Paraburkholderia tuberum]
MIGKAVVKVTLNEATDPDLFAYVKQFDNERMRAGALRALARAALNGGEARRGTSAAPFDAPFMRMTDAPTPRRVTEVTATVESGPAPTFSTGAASLAAVQPIEPFAVDPTVTGAKRFDTDAIADQFAGF